MTRESTRPLAGAVWMTRVVVVEVNPGQVECKVDEFSLLASSLD